MTGIICINKDADITSFGVCAKVRGITREKKVGHTGTLDPMATGVLPIMLGGATRFLNFLPDSDKAYRASFILGKTTDTLDITGNVLTEREVKADYDAVEKVLENFKGVITQLPPMYSAVSVDGKRLYELARQGKTVERQPREIEIKRLELAGENNGEYVIDVECSKGTYIRTLIDDIGQSLGCGAVMTKLVRTKAMGFGIDDCVTLDELQKRHDSDGNFDDILLSIDKMLSSYPEVVVSFAQAKRFSNGGALDKTRLKAVPGEGVCRVYSPDGIFLGLGKIDNEKGELSVLRLLTKRD